MPNPVTATMTATAYSTFTVTEFQTPTAIPVLAAADPEIEVAEAEAEIEPEAEAEVILNEVAVEEVSTSSVAELPLAEESAPTTMEDNIVVDQTPTEASSCALEAVFPASLAFCAASA